MPGLRAKPSDALPNFTGRILDNGRYHLIRFLGSGAYGAVYRAVDLHAASSNEPNPHRAVKILRKAKISKNRTLCIKREVKHHAQMSSHPNVVTLRRAFEDCEYVFLVLDYCEGGTLFNQICKEGIYWKNDELIKKVFLQLVDAVLACHVNHVFHRDLKPENILVNEDGSIPYLADFGLATDERFCTTFGAGSSHFMSPECIGKERDFQMYSTSHADIWSLGIILLNLITARSPWTKALTTEATYNDFLTRPEVLRELLPLSDGAAAIIISLLDPVPTERLSLTALREAIIGLDTFFMSDEEITLSGECIRIVADSFARKAKWRALEKCKPDILPCMVRTRFKPKFILEKSEGENKAEFQVFKAPPPPPAPKPPTSAPPSDAAQANTRTPDSPGITTDESAGLITPETHPVDPVVVVSELGEGIKGDAEEESQNKAGPEVVLLTEQQPIAIAA